MEEGRRVSGLDYGWRVEVLERYPRTTNHTEVTESAGRHREHAEAAMGGLSGV